MHLKLLLIVYGGLFAALAYAGFLEARSSTCRLPPFWCYPKKKKKSWSLGSALMIGGGVVAGAAAIPVALGFGTAGIVASSVAAGMQASVGQIAAGSAFSIAQSLGMQGVFASAASAGGATAGLGAALKFWKRDDEEK